MMGIAIFSNFSFSERRVKLRTNTVPKKTGNRPYKKQYALCQILNFPKHGSGRQIMGMGIITFKQDIEPKADADVIIRSLVPCSAAI